MDELRERILEGLREGFRSPADVLDAALEAACDELSDDEAEALQAAGPALLAEVQAQLIIEQGAWPAETDCDRLDRAFDDLNARGILARHNGWCCQTCGHGAMPAEHDAAVAAGRPSRGYAFYHEQDTESAVQGHGICLAYGAFGDDSTLAIAQEVVATLEQNGLDVEWDGTVERRISVPMRWQRRTRPARWCEEP